MICWPDAALLEGTSDHQREQYTLATTGRVGLLSGGPGTGKTRTAAAMIKAIEKQNEILHELAGDGNTLRDVELSLQATRAGIDRASNPSLIAVCAPTGKAATRSTEFLKANGISLQATTIHRLLEVQKTGYDGEGWEFFHDETEPLPFDYVFCDEPSMVDTDLMAALLRAIRPGAHVMFTGDPFQLPPVGHGRPFDDMIKAGLPHGQLTEIWRFAGRIAHVCDAIKHGRAWSPSPRIDLDCPSPENLKHIPSHSPGETIQHTVEMVMKLVGVSAGHPLLRGLNPISDIQVLCPIREKSNVAVKVLNKILQEQLNPLAGRAEVSGLRVGDKVMCTLNQWVDAYEDDVKPLLFFSPRNRTPRTQPLRARSQHYISNGDIGEVLDAEARQILIRFTDRTVLFKPPYDRLELAYAITGHKSQGSQWPVTLSLIDDGGAAARVCNRSYWYTVLSRASRLCITIGRDHILRTHCRQVPLERRVTFLRSGIESWRTQSLLSASS
jgi:exodeoxyribonuclease V alpha subunit